MEVRTRYAPSPTGFMHVGNLRTALYEYLIAKSQGGKFILRIEDTDQERLVDGAVEVIYHTLDMVGLKHDEGPDRGGEYGPYVQSQRKDMYKPYAEQLVKEGKGLLLLLYQREAGRPPPGAGRRRRLRPPLPGSAPERGRQASGSGSPLCYSSENAAGGLYHLPGRGLRRDHGGK